MALSSVLVSLGTLIAIYGILALGLNIKFGYTGLLDIGHVAFYLIGAYVTALLVLPPQEQQQFARYILGWNLPWVVAISVGIIAAGLLGMLVALPAIRLREDYLAIAVLGISVIVKRTFQTETWLANGPDALRGWSSPLNDFFTLPGPTAESLTLFGVSIPTFNWILFGLIVGLFWAIGTYLLGTVMEPTDNPTSRTVRGGIVHGLFALLTGGIGYLAIRLGHRTDRGPLLPAVVTGILVGLLAYGMAIVGLGPFAAFVFLGLLSLFSWALGGVLVARHYEEMSPQVALIGLGLAVAFIVALLPLVVLGIEGGEGASRIGLLVTLGFLAAFLYGLYYLGNNWERYSYDTPFISVIGVAAIWLFLLRYFVIAGLRAFRNAGISGVTLEIMQNLLWLLRIGARVEFDYSRFLFFLSVVLLVGAYVLTEVTVASPFGRVLKAIREDEDVAQALGKDTFSFKVQSMILGSAMAGLAGGLTAIYFGALVHTMFAPRITFIVLLMVIIGGTANNKGVILGAVIYWGFNKGTEDLAGFFPPEARSSVAALRLVVIGALLIIILYYRPEGIWGEEHMAAAEAEEE